MRVAFSDPQGPRRWRLAPYAGSLALLVFGCLSPWGLASGLMMGVLAVGLVGLVGVLPYRQRRLRSCELVTGPGSIEIRAAGTRTQRIEAKSILGGTTARTEKGILFTLAHAKRDQPMTLIVDNGADADRVRHALGIGHGGFGSVGWRVASSSTANAAWWGALLTFLWSIVLVWIGVSSGGFLMGLAAMATSHLAAVAVIGSLVARFGRAAPPSIAMTAEGLSLQTRQGWFTLPYDHVLNIEHSGGSLRFTVPAPYHAVEVEDAGKRMSAGLGPDDREGLIQQIMAAAARARGLGAMKDDATGRVDVLRRNGESPRDWLTRLDMAGRMLESTAAGYRGHTLDHEDLWTVLEDPEADAELRAGAARVLRHSVKPETRVRIDAAVAAVREEIVNRRLRIAVDDDVDHASQELAALDSQDPLLPGRAMLRR